MTLAVRNLGPHLVSRGSPVHIAGLMWLDAAGARLYDWEDDHSVPFADPEACAAVRAVLVPPSEYLGGALMQVWVRDGPSGTELHGTYWILLGERNEPASRWGPRIEVRPVQPRYDHCRL